ncbi:D-2-hydroxyglutarate dehydrogenase YdiJ [Rhizobium jaguaris]|uniref:D-2-hydroxyglutarate dehydrogenase n=1 Tax=Rhizobium jaguaris TaxID=1312183 RepID=A0A387G9K4_9HYPH|nr:FAD-binding and (Fe-S)-binding domain-containing protein [Rhizobium jaguaris]AYG64491.1 FAD-binding oxidoreductase [Rhizobium jaguaris]
MIPRLTLDRAFEPPSPGFLERLIERGFRGDIETGRASAIVASTDNSIYEIMPAGVLYPKDGDDLRLVAKTLGEPGFENIIMTPRGGATGTNGQSLTRGFVVDCSRHMTRILSVDVDNRIARVEAGVVKDQLNQAIRQYGLFFAPELSTSNRATIGGMVSTDACGQGSCVYGKTSNHVLGLRIALTDGTDWWARPSDDQELSRLIARTDRIGEIHRVARTIQIEKKDLIDRTFPRLNRYMTGYDLAHVMRDDGRFDLASIICGSEGTLAFIAEAELNLLPIPAEAAVINIRYDDFNAALEDARALAALGVASVETIDEKVLRLAKGDIVWSSIGRFFPDDGQTNGINIVEVLADDREGLASKLASVTAALEQSGGTGRRGHTIADQAEDVEAIWTMRKRAVGLLGNVDGPVRPVAFVEDTAVPPENLASYIREFRALLDAEGLDYGMFGHVDAGVLHVRPALDLTRPEHEALVRRISDAVVDLTRKYGGVLWGEHGKGVRSEYVREYFGELYESLNDIKRAFDPYDQLNPGKIATARSTPLIRIDEPPLRGQMDRVIAADARISYGNASFCNGNGACFDFEADSPMCPSYKGTRDRRYSPKGRAMLFKEWLRLLGGARANPLDAKRLIGSGDRLLSVPVRVWHSLNPANRTDFSHEVRQAVDNCLACKACAGQCPVKVNVPDFRSKFLELYHARYLRPLKDPIVAAMEQVLPWLARVRRAYNVVVRSRLGQFAMSLLGLTALPELPTVDLWRELRRRGVEAATPENLRGLPAPDRANSVVFVVDAFTSYYNPELVIAAVSLARKLGLHPFVRRSISNGKALHVHGYLQRFEKTARRNAANLTALASTGSTLVGLDPSMTLAFRSEYKDLVKAVPTVLLPQEWLISLGARLGQLSRRQGLKARLLLHCTERTNAASSKKDWEAVFESVGVHLSIPPVGCCGMAGTFGHEVRNRELSERIYAMSWGKEMDRADGAEPLATGFSCQSQVRKANDRRLRHPIEFLHDLQQP